MQKKSYVFVMPSLSLEGGQQRQGCNLAAALIAQGHRVTVLSLQEDMRMAPEFSRVGCKVHGPPQNHFPLLTPWGMHESLKRWFAKHAVDAELLIWNPFYGTQYAIIAALERGLTPILMVQNVLSREAREMPEGCRFLTEEAIEQCPLFIACSKEAAEDLTQTYGVDPARVSILPNIGKVASEVGNVSGSTVVTVGRICPQKNTLLFVKAAALVAARFPDATFEIVGDALPAFAQYKAQVQREIERCGLVAKCTITGWLDHDATLGKMKESAVYVVSSDYEGSSLALQEAMSLGACVVSTDSGDAAKLLGDGVGIVVPAGNAEALADGICAVLTDEKLRARLGRRAWERMRAEGGEEYVRAFHATLDARRSTLEAGVRNAAGRPRSSPRPFPSSVKRPASSLTHPLIIYGAGKDGRKFTQWLRGKGRARQIKLTWDDSASGPGIHKPIDGFEKGDLVIVCSSAYSRQMEQKLKAMGLTRGTDFLTLEDFGSVLDESDVVEFVASLS